MGKCSYYYLATKSLTDDQAHILEHAVLYELQEYILRHNHGVVGDLGDFSGETFSGMILLSIYIINPKYELSVADFFDEIVKPSDEAIRYGIKSVQCECRSRTTSMNIDRLTAIYSDMLSELHFSKLERGYVADYNDGNTTNNNIVHDSSLDLDADVQFVEVDISFRIRIASVGQLAVFAEMMPALGECANQAVRLRGGYARSKWAEYANGEVVFYSSYTLSKVDFVRNELLDMVMANLKKIQSNMVSMIGSLNRERRLPDQIMSYYHVLGLLTSNRLRAKYNTNEEWKRIIDRIRVEVDTV